MDFRSVYTPSAWQSEFHAAPFREMLGAGAAGPGKSLALLWDPFFQVFVEHLRCVDPNHPNHQPMGTSSGHSLHLRRKMSMLSETISRSKRWFPMIDPGAKYSESHNSPKWTMSSGYIYQFGHCNDRDSWQLYQGLELTYLAFDELCQFERKQYEEICARVRSTDPILKDMLKIRSASNPVTRFEGGGASIMIDDPDWVRTMFVDPAPMGRTIIRKTVTMSSGKKGTIDRFYLPATLADNPDPVFREQYELSLRSRPKHIREAYLKGNWYITPGSFFGDDWDMEKHVCRKFRIPKDWHVWRGMDWGYKAWGTVGWWAMSPDNVIYKFYEHSFKRTSARQCAKDILDIEEKLGIPRKDNGDSSIIGPADNQLWEERGSDAVTKAEEMSEEGVLWIKADKKSRMRNAQLMMDRILDYNDQDPTPGIVVFENCKDTIRTVPAIPHDENNPEVPKDGGQDHWLDECLYSVAYASRGPEGLVDLGENDDDFPDRPRRKSRGSNWGYGSSL